MENDSNFQESQLFQKELTEIEELDDPIEVYLRYISWLFEHYDKQQLRETLLPILEQATEYFKDDLRYSNDPRYFRLWILYSKHTTDPEAVFKHLQQIQVSTNLAAFYEEYASLLARKERIEEAGRIFEQGIQRKAMPFVRLQRKFQEFQKVTGYRPSLKPKNEKLTRAEKLAVNLDLFYSQNEEFCFEEMRARLSKHKNSNSNTKSSKEPERFSNSRPTENLTRPTKSEEPFTEVSSKKKGLPSPTINTKAALADILEIFNQPLKCEQYDSDDNDYYYDDEYSPIEKTTDKRSEVHRGSQDRALYDENQHPSYKDENKKGSSTSRVPFAPKAHGDETASTQPKNTKSFSVFQDSYEMPLSDTLQHNLNHSYSEKPVSNKQFDLFRSRKSLPNLHGNRALLENDDSSVEAYQDSPQESASRFPYSQQENEQYAKLPEKAFKVYQDENAMPSSRKTGRAFDVFCDDNYSGSHSTEDAKPFSMSNNSQHNPAQEHALFSVHKPSTFSQQKTPQHTGRGPSDRFGTIDDDQRRQFYVDNPPGSSLLNKFSQKLNFLSDGSDGENEFRESIYRQ